MDIRRIIRELLFVNLSSWIAVSVRMVGRAGLMMIAAVLLVACGGSSSADTDSGGSASKGSLTTVEFQVELCEVDGTCKGLYEGTRIDLLVDGEQWSGGPIVTTESPLGPYRAIVEVPGNATLTVTPQGEGTIGETIGIAVGDISSGTCSDMSTCPVLIITLREE